MSSWRTILASAFFLLIAACDSEDEMVATEPITVKSKIGVKIKVGDYIYENVDAVLQIKGFDVNNKQVWQTEFDYSGGTENIIDVDGKYHHYSFTINKWGVTDEQIVTFTELYKQRADGPQPTTYILGGEVEPKRLSSRTFYMQNNNVNAPEMVPYSRILYAYNDAGRISEMIHQEYNPTLETFESKRSFNFEYENNRLETISCYDIGSEEAYLTDTYEYFPNGNVSHISENNAGAGINSSVYLNYDYSSGEIAATYSSSNGQGFTYQFDYQLKNITSDKTTKGAQTCSEGSYAYDKNINPLRHLGYVDFLLTNLSVNNKTMENVNYMACAFPELIPQSYEYTYDDDGYPTKSTVNYSGDFSGQIIFTYE